MPVEISPLAKFYESPRGQMARRLIAQRLRARWPDLRGRRLLGLGYARPYLRPYRAEAERVIAAEPASGGWAAWPPDGPVRVAAVEEHSLPFPDAFFDGVLLVHGLETAEGVRALMREIWRVMAADGRLLVVVPNRTGLWAQFESSPFGHGRPYSRGQLQRLLEGALFEVGHWDSALFIPPFVRRAARLGRAWERIGRRLWPRLAGVHIVEAAKTLYAPVPVEAAKVRALRPATAR